MSRSLTVAQKRGRIESIWAEMQYRRYGDGVEGFKSWCSELYWVRSKNDPRGRSLFDLYPFQREMADAYFSNKYVVCLKSRQLGATTLGMAYALWQATYKPGGATVLVLSKTQVDARANLQMVKHALSFFPDWYTARMPQIEAESNDRLVLRHADGTASMVECLVATERSGASRTADVVVADEAALWSHPDDTFRSIAPATDAAAAAPGNQAVMLVFSTARGGSNFFASLYKDAVAGRNRYKPLFYSWKDNPLSNPKALEGEVDYSIYNARKSEFASEPHRFFSEYPSTPEEAFKSSGHSRFTNLPSITEFEEMLFRGNVSSNGTFAQFVDDETGIVRLSFDPRFEFPSSGYQVVIGADPALGVGNDSSVAYAVCYTPDGAAQLLGYVASNQLEPLEFADVLYSFGMLFAAGSRPALIACEYQPGGGGGGQTVVARLRERGYSNLYQYVQPASKGRKALSFYGMPITRATKPLLINTLAEWLTPDELSGELRVANVPPILRDELGTFVVKPNGTVAADVGTHDDHVLAAAISMYVLSTAVRAPAVKPLQVDDAPPPQQGLRLDLTEIRKDIDRQMRVGAKKRARETARLARRFRPR